MSARSRRSSRGSDFVAGVIIFASCALAALIGTSLYRHARHDVQTIRQTTAATAEAFAPLNQRNETASPQKNLESVTARLNPEDTRKIQILVEILHSKNDNDPRMDREFRQMSPALKRSLEGEYERFSRERRNERGTIAFLLARDASEPRDLEFVQKVFAEEPCRSLADCYRDPIAGSAIDPGSDHSVDSDTLLAYPQVLTLSALGLNRNEALRPEIAKLILAQRSSKNERLARQAQRLSE